MRRSRLWQNPSVAVETDRLISAKPSSVQEEQIERSLRPATLAEYVGQDKIREIGRAHV